jgi:flavin-dependent dehydrogenase
MADFFDILIVGGGPAGSTAGTLLAKQGWNVAIFEKETFPRFKIGESLLPGSWSLRFPPLTRKRDIYESRREQREFGL